MTPGQKREYLLLRANLPLDKIAPMLYGRALMRMNENIQAGLELGLSHEESYQMACEDFVSLPEKLLVMEAQNHNQWFKSMDEQELWEFYREMIMTYGKPKIR